MPPMYYVYILKHNVTNDNGDEYYVGYTRNSFKRILAHIWGTGALATFQYGVKEIVYLEICEHYYDARDAEIIYREKIREGWIPQQNCSFLHPNTIGLLGMRYEFDKHDIQLAHERFL